jgi:O-antigen/teichoic acid export membrane protein
VLRHFIRRFRESKLLRQAGTLITGTAMAQVVALLASPLLTRIYSPDAFGVWTLYTSVVVAITTLAALRYDLAIMLPKSNAEATALMRLSIRAVFATGTLLTLLAALLGPLVVRELPTLHPWVYLCGVNVACLGAFQIYVHALNRAQDYRGMASGRIVQALLTAPIQVGLGGLSFGPAGLIVGTLSAHAASAFYLRRRARTAVPVNKNESKPRIAPLAKKYWRLPVLNGPHAIADAVRLNGINVLMGALYGSAMLGQYGLAWRTALLPSSLINGALGEVYYQRLSVAPRGQMTRLVFKFAAFSLAAGIVPFGILALFGDVLFGFIFGQEWTEAGVIAASLSPWLLAMFVTSPLSRVFIVTNMQFAALLWAVLSTAVPLVIISAHTDDFRAMISTLSWAMCGMMVIFFALIVFVCRRWDRAIEPEAS